MDFETEVGVTNFQNDKLEKKWNFILDIRKVITGALELKRAEKIIGSSLQANIKLYITEEQKKLIEGIDIAEIGIVSSFNFITSKIPDKAFTIDTINHVGVVIDKAEGEKCARCWKVLPEVKGKEICGRCKNVIN